MTFALRLVLAGFAAFRLAELFVLDDGPYYMFRNLRTWLGRKAAGSDVRSTWYMLAQLLGCPFCVGVWFSALLTIPVFLPTIVTDVIITWLAIAGFQTALENRSNHK